MYLGLGREYEIKKDQTTFWALTTQGPYKYRQLSVNKQSTCDGL